MIDSTINTITTYTCMDMDTPCLLPLPCHLQGDYASVRELLVRRSVACTHTKCTRTTHNFKVKGQLPPSCPSCRVLDQLLKIVIRYFSMSLLIGTIFMSCCEKSRYVASENQRCQFDNAIKNRVWYFSISLIVCTIFSLDTNDNRYGFYVCVRVCTCTEFTAVLKSLGFLNVVKIISNL